MFAQDNDNSNGEQSNRMANGGPKLAVAQAITSHLHGGAPDPRALYAARRVPQAKPTLTQFVSALEDLVASDPSLKTTLEERLAQVVREALAKQDDAVPSTAEFLAMVRGPTVASTRGGTVARAFWWGFHIEISHADLLGFLTTAEPVNALIGALGGGIPSPASPFIALAAAFVGGALGLLRNLDHGRGVYVSMTWFAPGIFVPTSV